MAVTGTNECPTLVGIPHAQEEGRAKPRQLAMAPFPKTSVIETGTPVPLGSLVQTSGLVRAGSSIQGPPPNETAIPETVSVMGLASQGSLKPSAARLMMDPRFEGPVRRHGLEPVSPVARELANSIALGRPLMPESVT